MTNFRRTFCTTAAALAFALITPAFGESWSVKDVENTEQPGRRINVTHNDQLLASLIHGEGQMKTFLQIYGEDGELLTNPGLNAEGETVGRFPHHRGIFIGWNQIRTDLGSDDLWHMREGGEIELANYEVETVSPGGTKLDTVMHWRSRHADDSENLVLVENRTMTLTRPQSGGTVVDFETTLTAERDVELGGDLQHAGVHFRAHHTVDDRRGETSYLWEPADLEGGGGRIVHNGLKWVTHLFPIGDNWYRATQLNAPSNPTTELSWRDYGRFGFFHKDKLAAGDARDLSYRFIIEPVDAPQEPGNLNDAEQATHREAAANHYAAYLETLPE